MLLAGGVLEAVDGADVVVDDEAESDELDGVLDDPEASELPDPSDFFAPLFDDEYRSAYHPPPLNCTAGALSSFSSLPSQYGHTVSSGSENFCRFSNVRPQFWH